jgi:uncharacterized membrane protein YesL
MMRLAGVILVAVLVAFPLAAWPGAPVAWLAAVTFVVGGGGVIVWSVSLVTIGAALALITYTLALLIARPAADPVAAIVFGATLVVLPTLVHFAGRSHGAALGPAVLASQVRQSLVVVLAGVVAAGVLTVGAAALGPVLGGATLPIVVVIAVLGAVLTVAGVVALTTREDPPA